MAALVQSFAYPIWSSRLTAGPCRLARVSAMPEEQALALAETWVKFLGMTKQGQPVVMLEPPIVLTDRELIALTGYKRRALQLAELHRQGFHRARLGTLGNVILERAHYEAVCGGAIEKPRPKLRPICREQPKWTVHPK